MSSITAKKWYQLPAQLLIKLIGGYQLLISPLLGSNCRFHPSCSCYAKQAIQQYGFLKGAYLSSLRLSKCHPFHPGGFDPLPGETTHTSEIN